MGKTLGSARQDQPSSRVIGTVMRGVVQIVALRQGFLGGMSPAWTGSGTIVDASGIILTNCHVANPRALGMSAPPADRLGIAITERSDEPPVLTYFAEIVAQSPEIDLAVLRIVDRLDGKPLSRLNLPAVPLGDSDSLELGDTLSILGYPGIGGETVTFTSGSVSGFTKQEGVHTRRAWVKTDATIAGGNSGGTELFATFAYQGMRKGLEWGQAWALDGKTIVSEQAKWEDGVAGRKVLSLSKGSGLPDGTYHLVVTMARQVLAEGEVVLGKRAEDTDTEISGQTVNQATAAAEFRTRW